jgi:hypothetical protein
MLESNFKNENFLENQEDKFDERYHLNGKLRVIYFKQ